MNLNDDKIQPCAHCQGWVDTTVDHYVKGMIGHVNRRPIHLHGDWCAEVFEASHPLADREEKNRRGRK